MTFLKYLKDHFLSVIVLFISFSIVGYVTYFYTNNYDFTIFIGVILGFAFIFTILYEYYRRAFFYKRLSKQLDQLNQKYLITEMMDSPRFLEGQLLKEYLYDIDKSMIERIERYKRQSEDFSQYVEMWIHEIKLPIASCHLMIHNQSDPSLIISQLDKIENGTEQVLYYVRSHTAKKDYLIQCYSLKPIINEVIKRFKTEFRLYKMPLELSCLDVEIYTDRKWLSFMLSQIITNAFQFMKQDGHDKLKIHCIVDNNKTILNITDYGVGICKEDLKRVLEKSFTGQNGRVHRESTGMGLYICDLLCHQLGHELKVSSVQGEYTTLSISFYHTDYYDVTRNLT